MANNFIEELDTSKVERMKKPFVVVIFGLPGSGKTHVSQILAKELGVYLLSGDYVRLHYYKILEDSFAAKR